MSPTTVSEFYYAHRYNSSDHAALLRTLQLLCESRPNTTVILAHQRRPYPAHLPADVTGTGNGASTPVADPEAAFIAAAEEIGFAVARSLPLPLPDAGVVSGFVPGVAKSVVALTLHWRREESAATVAPAAAEEVSTTDLAS